jgi:phosphoglycolate phosphatase-like HAD superfamily hydrolase
MKIAFDLDGTLITTLDRQILLLSTLMKSFDKSLDIKQIWNLKRMGISTFESLILCGIENKLATTISKFWNSEIESFYWLGIDRTFPDTTLVLSELSLKRYHIYLLTARKNEYLLHNQLIKLDLKKYFKNIYVVNPKNSFYEKGLILKTLKPNYFVGDTESDFLASVDSNTKFLAVTTGQRDRKFLVHNGVNNIYNNLTECLDHITKNNFTSI